LEELAHLEKQFDQLDHEIFNVTIDQADEFAEMMKVLRKLVH
jgi:hypothetical protein